MNYLLDTTALSDLFRREPHTIARMNSLSPSTDVAAVSVVSYAEIRFGLAIMPQGQRRQRTEREAQTLFTRVPMEEVDEAVADAYVQIKVMLQASGQIIPEADIWIAATALVGNYTLVTRDAHFSRILGIHVEDWSRP